MDTSLPCGRDAVIVSNPPPLLTQASNEGSVVESPVFRLPNEITMLVFRLCEPYIRHRLPLTHTCRRWRHIAVNDASLWTTIRILTSSRSQKARLDNFLSFLGMQLDRTANLPLHVKWIAEIGDDYFAGALQLIREKAPFSRWRTLVIKVTGGSHGDAPWSSIDAFTNLEYLFIWSETERTILSVIDSTITSRLKVLDLRKWKPNVTTTFAKSFTHISSLLLPYPHDIQFLPANVANLYLVEGRDHPFPHIQMYNLQACIFVGNSIDLRNMTILVVTGSLVICSDCHVFLPALRELTLGRLRMEINAKIDAPALDILYFTDNNGRNMRLLSTHSSLLEPGYLLSPTTSIIADSYLSSTTLLNILAKSPKVTNATLRFDHWTGAHEVLERLVAFGTQTDLRSTENESLCPRLSELRLYFGWELDDRSASKRWLLYRLKSRREAGITLPLSIYAGWKGEGTYVLLSGD